MQVLEQLGLVTTRSGVLIVIDTGCLDLWSHDQIPVLPDGVLDTDEATLRANSFVDLRIVGSDAERAGRILDMSWHPLYVYDQPPDHLDLQNRFEQVVRQNLLDARLEVIPDRVPHRKRAELAIQQGRGAGEVQFHGIWSVAIGGVPTMQPITVLAERSESVQDRWHRVVIACRPQVRIGRTERIGTVAVDHARLLIADIDALAAWKHEESIDGLADYVFWGRDAEVVAAAVGAPRLESGECGWLNLPEEIAQERGLAVERYRDEHSLKLGGDYRPHSDHWRAMTPTRTSQTESATIELAETKVCNFMTTWGDGFFDVHRDLSESGDLVQIRIEMEPPSDVTQTKPIKVS